MREALLYEVLPDHRVNCLLCAHHCRIAEGSFGLCSVRENLKGKLYTHAYGRVCAAAADPVEKKPLYHFLPGSKSFSVATLGCNFRCGFCQNWEISQSTPRAGLSSGKEMSAQRIVSAARESSCQSISYTYTEPTIFFEYALDSAKLAREAGLKNIFVTNGYITAEALKMIRPWLDAANVDLKFFQEESYRKICGAKLAPVLDSIRLMHQLGVWVEITTLIVPGENDSPQELAQIAQFIAGIDQDMPWHVSRFHPDYKFQEYASTPEDILKQAAEIGRKAGLNYVYAGNVHGWGSDTPCLGCKKLVIRREGFSVLENHIQESKCAYCGTRIAGVY